LLLGELRALIANLMDRVDVAERVWCEDNVMQMASLEWLHYFQSHLRERLVVVWYGKKQLTEKVEKLETWMPHYEGHVQCDYFPPPPPRMTPNNPASITSDD